jgi:hypothetical protein
MSRVGFELTISVFEQAKTVHAVDRAATVNGHMVLTSSIKLYILHFLKCLKWGVGKLRIEANIFT